MTKWEYCSIEKRDDEVAHTLYQEEGDWPVKPTTYGIRRGGIPLEKTWKRTIKTLGTLGWEAISVIFVHGDETWYFKRPIRATNQTLDIEKINETTPQSPQQAE